MDIRPEPDADAVEENYGTFRLGPVRTIPVGKIGMWGVLNEGDEIILLLSSKSNATRLEDILEDL